MNSVCCYRDLDHEWLWPPGNPRREGSGSQTSTQVVPTRGLADRPHACSSAPSVAQVLAALQEMPPSRVLALRQQTQFLWDTYFSSVEKVIRTTLEVRGTPLAGAPASPLPGTSSALSGPPPKDTPGMKLRLELLDAFLPPSVQAQLWHVPAPADRSWLPGVCWEGFWGWKVS